MMLWLVAGREISAAEYHQKGRVNNQDRDGGKGKRPSELMRLESETVIIRGALKALHGPKKVHNL